MKNILYYSELEIQKFYLIFVLNSIILKPPLRPLPPSSKYKPFLIYFSDRGNTQPVNSNQVQKLQKGKEAKSNWGTVKATNKSKLWKISLILPIFPHFPFFLPIQGVASAHENGGEGEQVLPLLPPPPENAPAGVVSEEWRRKRSGRCKETLITH